MVGQARGVSPAPGYLVFTHGRGPIAWAIRFGEWIRFRRGDHWNHTAVIERRAASGEDWVVIEATARGVTRGLLSTIAPGGGYEVVALPAGVEPSAVVQFARRQLGDAYGWLSIVALAVQIVLPRWFRLPSFRSRRTWICSALAAEAVRCGRWIHDWPDIYQVVPSELFAALTTPHPVSTPTALAA